MRWFLLVVFITLSAASVAQFAQQAGKHSLLHPPQRSRANPSCELSQGQNPNGVRDKKRHPTQDDRHHTARGVNFVKLLQWHRICKDHIDR